MGTFGRYLVAMFLGLATTAAAAGDAARFIDLSSATRVNPHSKLRLAAASRGELLYENHCTVCHTSVVHIRQNRQARSMADLRRWVRRWSGDLKLNWSDEEINDVAEFLARRFYKFEDKT